MREDNNWRSRTLCLQGITRCLKSDATQARSKRRTPLVYCEAEKASAMVAALLPHKMPSAQLTAHAAPPPTLKGRQPVRCQATISSCSCSTSYASSNSWSGLSSRYAGAFRTNLHDNA